MTNIKIKENLKKQEGYIIQAFTENNICLEFDDKKKKVLLGGYTIYYSSKLSLLQTLEEVFIKQAYYFPASVTNPRIIDAGSEVGIATIFFKILYPRARIICFEAHPHVCGLLYKNIRVNKLKNVKVVNAALANVERTIDFFGEFDLAVKDLDVRGNSIFREWGIQRETSSVIKVNAVKLSKYIEHNVEYLKLNIEGAEQQVLEDLAQNNKIKFIRNILVKFHHSPRTQHLNNLDDVCSLLGRNQFVMKKKIEKSPGQVFSNVTKKWAAKNRVRLYTLLVQRVNGRKIKSKITQCIMRKNIYALGRQSLEKISFLLNSIIENVPSSVYWKDRDGIYLGHSAYAVQKLHSTKIAPGATIKNVVGKSDYDVFTKKVADNYRKNDLLVMNNRENIVLEESVVTPDGKKLIQLSSKKPLCDEKNNIIGLIGSTIDITDRKKTERLQKEKEIAEQVTRRMEMLAGCVAHEIRNPLCAININIGNLQKMGIKGRSKSINNIKAALKRSTNIVDMLLIKLRSTVTKKINNQSFTYIAIKACIEKALAEYPFDEGERQCVIWDKKVSEDFIYKGDNLFTKHVLFNLIKNALKAIKEIEKGKIYINLRTGRNFNHLIFKDTATGIPYDTLKNLFQSFNSSSKVGTGLGLAFCKLVMRAYDGNIRCNSCKGKFTEFVLNFPKKRQA